MANPNLDSLNVSINDLKARDYRNDEKAPQDGATDRFFAEADKLLAGCHNRAGVKAFMYAGPEGDVLCREDQSVVLNFKNGREIILNQDHTQTMPLDAKK